jgi:hypothetical protein
LEILVKEKKLRDAKDLVSKDAGSYIKAGNVPITEKSPLKLNENAPETAIEHGASLTPVHEGGVLQAQIHDGKLFKFIDTVTANAPFQVIPDPCTSVHTTVQADSQAKQIDTEPNHPITHGASFSPSNVGGILQTQTEAEPAVQLTETDPMIAL